MSARVYILFDLVHAQSNQIARILQGKTGVTENLRVLPVDKSIVESPVKIGE